MYRLNDFGILDSCISSQNELVSCCEKLLNVENKKIVKM